MPAVSGIGMLTDCLMSEQTFHPQEMGAAEIHVWLGTQKPEKNLGSQSSVSCLLGLNK